MGGEGEGKGEGEERVGKGGRGKKREKTRRRMEKGERGEEIDAIVCVCDCFSQRQLWVLTSIVWRRRRKWTYFPLTTPRSLQCRYTKAPTSPLSTYANVDVTHTMNLSLCVPQVMMLTITLCRKLNWRSCMVPETNLRWTLPSVP